jgi:hypothetical protein
MWFRCGPACEQAHDDTYLMRKVEVTNYLSLSLSGSLAVGLDTVVLAQYAVRNHSCAHSNLKFDRHSKGPESTSLHNVGFAC